MEFKLHGVTPGDVGQTQVLPTELLPTFGRFDVTEHLPLMWREQLIALSRSAEDVVRPVDSGLAEIAIPEDLTHGVVPVHVIDQPTTSWLRGFQTGMGLHLASRLSGKSLEPAPDPDGLKVNVVEPGQRIAIHTEDFACTAVIFATPPEGFGGGSIKFSVGNKFAVVTPEVGVMVVYDGRETPHEVPRLVGSFSRVTSVMHFRECSGR